MATIKTLKRRPLMALPDLDVHEIHAIKGLQRGDASPEQQRMAFEVILKKFCHIGGLSYAGEATHDSAFAEGRRSVAINLMVVATEPVQKLTTAPGSKDD